MPLTLTVTKSGDEVRAAAPLAFTICRRFRPALSISISNSRGGTNVLHAAQLRTILMRLFCSLTRARYSPYSPRAGS